MDKRENSLKNNKQHLPPGILSYGAKMTEFS